MARSRTQARPRGAVPGTGCAGHCSGPQPLAATRLCRGSAKEQLNVNDPHVPEPIGAGFLRDKIPGLADEMQKWPVFLRDLEMNLHLRTFYFDRELPIRPRPLTGSVDVNQEAWAIGG
jgi:hypothetical protein